MSNFHHHLPWEEKSERRNHRISVKGPSFLWPRYDAALKYDTTGLPLSLPLSLSFFSLSLSLPLSPSWGKYVCLPNQCGFAGSLGFRLCNKRWKIMMMEKMLLDIFQRWIWGTQSSGKLNSFIKKWNGCLDALMSTLVGVIHGPSSF